MVIPKHPFREAMALLAVIVCVVACQTRMDETAQYRYDLSTLVCLPTVTPTWGRSFEEVAADWQASGEQVYVFRVDAIEVEQIGDRTYCLDEGQPLNLTLRMLNLYPDKTTMLYMVLVDGQPVTATMASQVSRRHVQPLPYNTLVSLPISIRPLTPGFHDVILVGFANPYRHDMEPGEWYNRSQDFIAYRLSVIVGEPLAQAHKPFDEPPLFLREYDLGPVLTLSDRADVPHQWLTTTVSPGQHISYHIFTAAVSSQTPCDEFALIAFLDYQPVPINAGINSPYYARVCDRHTARIQGEIEAPLEPSPHELILMRIPNPRLPFMVIRAQPGVEPFDYDPDISERVLIEVQAALSTSVRLDESLDQPEPPDASRLGRPVGAFELPAGLVIRTINGEPGEGVDESAWGETPPPIYCYDELPLCVSPDPATWQALQAQHPDKTDWSDGRPSSPVRLTP